MIDLNIITYFAADCPKSYLTMPTWFKYLEVKKNDYGQCSVENFRVPGDFLPVGLALIDILFRVVGIVAVFFIVYGGVQYVISQGEPDKTSKAQNTIQNALLGLVLAFVAVAVVGFIGRRLSS